MDHAGLSASALACQLDEGKTLTDTAEPGSFPPPDSHLVIVSNRGPKDFVWQADGWTTAPASGGLVSMLKPLAGRPDVSWFCCVSEPPDAEQAERSLFTTAADQESDALRVVPIRLPAAMYEAYYGKISNEILWMLQHLLIGRTGIGQINEDRHAAWAQYLEANRQIASAIASACPAPSGFLLQDYHLYPLPKVLRRYFPSVPILHFTHIPFPEPSLLKLLPSEWGRQIVEGLLAADVVGLQTHSDVQAFLACCAELVKTATVDLAGETVQAEDGRLVRVRAYAASVDPAEIRGAMQSDAVMHARRRLFPEPRRRSIIRVDRLDPSKNQLIGFRAFARLLEMRPDLRGDVRFLAFLVPSRTDLRVYRDYRAEVLRTIEGINARFGQPGHEGPIEVFYTNDREQALAAMADCDVMLINSLRDGMNLVAKEWAVVSERPGVLVLSETAGAAERAQDCALCISPLDAEGTALALAAALDMPVGERASRLATLRSRVKAWTAQDWLAGQLTDLGCGLARSALPRP